MPFQLLNVDEVAEYLHLTPADVKERVKNREIPFELRGKRVIFRKSEIEEWASRRILNLPEKRLTAYHGKSTRHTDQILPHEVILPQLLEAGVVASALPSKTKSSVLCDLATLAEKTGNVSDAKALLAALKSREELCSTGMPGGFVLPHPRLHEDGLFEISFIVVARTIQWIPFGAPDGEPTSLFFLVCCQDERLHLLILARLCLMAVKSKALEQLQEAPAPESMRDALIATEREILNAQKSPS